MWSMLMQEEVVWSREWSQPSSGVRSGRHVSLTLESPVITRISITLSEYPCVHLDVSTNFPPELGTRDTCHTWLLTMIMMI